MKCGTNLCAKNTEIMNEAYKVCLQVFTAVNSLHKSGISENVVRKITIEGCKLGDKSVFLLIGTSFIANAYL